MVVGVSPQGGWHESFTLASVNTFFGVAFPSDYLVFQFGLGSDYRKGLF